MNILSGTFDQLSSSDNQLPKTSARTFAPNDNELNEVSLERGTQERVNLELRKFNQNLVNDKSHFPERDRAAGAVSIIGM